MTTREIVGRGTAEAVWRAAPLLPRLPPLALAPTPRRVVVVAPHPDDEVLGAGGLLARLAQRGAEPIVVALTDGEASHAVADPAALGARRAAETGEALRRLLGARVDVRRLRLPDGALGAHVDAAADGIAAALRPGAWCLATHPLDGHPDHEAAAQAAARACAAAGARLLHYPVWLWHWCRPDVDVGWARARRVDLPVAVAARKRRAVGAFASQVRPLPETGGEAILPPHVRARFERPFEVVFA